MASALRLPRGGGGFLASFLFAPGRAHQRVPPLSMILARRASAPRRRRSHIHPARPYECASGGSPTYLPGRPTSTRWRKSFDAIAPAQNGLQEGSDDRLLQHNEARRARLVRAQACRPLRTMFTRCLSTPRPTQSVVTTFFLPVLTKVVWIHPQPSRHIPSRVH